ncbi:uncharacterized protein EI97DRAFT_435912 [Westerdykella ornata]|uniref:Uncharacterized protein n=1 Tax=Westerdykella ornata TaxID=318751 RepID=A0A6A6JAW4_WESOR|nr:uncharacterized protein EI97DRAFT_435912 [Westerdykella ornata]KAF2273741.1 hypothetical protein EI97DRAFT_435912 [Westerdykella ornata]
MAFNNKLLLGAVPLVAAPALYFTYLTYLNRTLSRKVSCLTTPYLQDATLPVPPSVKTKSTPDILVHHEKAQKSIPSANLKQCPRSEVQTRFLRHTMSMFAKSAAAWSIWFLLKDPKDRCTFDKSYIRALDFAPGDRVCGVYVVDSRDKSRVVLRLDAPASYKGPAVEGLLVAEIREEGAEMVFVNHTVLWRRNGEGKPNVLESAMGRWVHGVMVRKLVESGVGRVVEEVGGKKGV